MNTPRKMLIAGSAATIVGLAGIAPTLYYSWQNHASAVVSKPISAPVIPKPSETVVVGKPAQIKIASVNISLPVADGVYDQKTGAWTLSTDKAHFALLSTPVNNEQGNTIIYGHNRKSVFSRLNKIKPGEKAEIITNNGYKFVYVFKSTKAVAPRDTSVFDYKGTPILTVQTCSGSWMQNRQLYTFDLESFSKI